MNDKLSLGLGISSRMLGGRVSDRRSTGTIQTMPDTPLRTPTLLSLVAPVYDEELLIEEFVARARAALADYDFELVLVDDGSKDRTPELLDAIASADPRVPAIHLSPPFAHHPALPAALHPPPPAAP